MYSTYSLFKSSLESEPYFNFLDIRCFRDGLVKLRTGVLPINGSSFRTTFSEDLNFLRPSGSVVEDEHHFVHVCPIYNDIRLKYLHETDLHYTSILQRGSTNLIRKLAMFIFYAIRQRNVGKV